MCKHLGVTIEVALILLYSLTYLRLGVSELELGRSWVVNRLVREVLVPRHFLNDTNTVYMANVMYKNLIDKIEVALILFYSQT